MRNSIVTLILFAIICGFSACKSETASSEKTAQEKVKDMRKQRAKAAVEKKQQQGVMRLSAFDFREKYRITENAQMMDVRTMKEVQGDGFIKGAKVNDFNDGQFEAELTRFDKDKPLFVYCAKGGRSSAAAKKMNDLGFKEIYDLKGGFTDWKKKGLDVERGYKKSN